MLIKQVKDVNGNLMYEKIQVEAENLHKRCKIRKIGMCIAVVVGVCVGGIHYAYNDSHAKVPVTDAYTNQNVQNVEYKYNDIEIMGYQPMDYAQCMSYILTSLIEAGKEPSSMKLNGVTLEEHLYNLNKAAKIEDVNPIVVLSQELIETGNFGFEGSSVQFDYYNYGGLGATNENPEPEKFPSNYIGQLAQVQHLVAYASTKEVNAELVDNRFKFVTNRGTDSTLAVLNQRWAVGNPNYAQDIANKYSAILSHKANIDVLKKYQGNEY